MIRLIESVLNLEDTEEYLSSKELHDEVVNNFDNFFNTKRVCNFIVDKCKDYLTSMSDEDENIDSLLPDIKVVSVISVDGDNCEVLTAQHYVLQYNGKYYDFCPTRYEKIFGTIEDDIPVVQKAIKSLNEITETVSTIKHYALLGR